MVAETCAPSSQRKLAASKGSRPARRPGETVRKSQEDNRRPLDRGCRLVPEEPTPEKGPRRGARRFARRRDEAACRIRHPPRGPLDRRGGACGLRGEGSGLRDDRGAGDAGVPRASRYDNRGGRGDAEHGPQPLGGVLLIVLATGLAGYALWKLVQGIMDPDQKGSDPHGILRRVGFVGSGVIHGGLAFTAAQSVFGAEDSSEDAMAASAMAFQRPLGPILVGLAAVGRDVRGAGDCSGTYALRSDPSYSGSPPASKTRPWSSSRRDLSPARCADGA